MQYLKHEPDYLFALFHHVGGIPQQPCWRRCSAHDVVNADTMARTEAKEILFDGSSDSSGEDDDQQEQAHLRVDEEFAKRFEVRTSACCWIIHDIY